jgi:hypothetical protein
MRCPQTYGEYDVKTVNMKHFRVFCGFLLLIERRIKKQWDFDHVNFPYKDIGILTIATTVFLNRDFDLCGIFRECQQDGPISVY